MIAKWRTREQLVHEAITLGKQGVSRRAIARALGISRNTVRALLDAHEAGRETETIAIEQRPSRAPRPAKIDAWKPRVAELMNPFPDITAQRVYEILRDEGFDGGYTRLMREGHGARATVTAWREQSSASGSARPTFGPSGTAERTSSTRAC